MELLLIDSSVVQNLLDPATAVEAVQDAFVALGRGEARMPPKVYLDVPQGDFRAMPAFIPGAAGIKWINVHTQNPARNGLPTVMALLIYNDPETGQPLAVMDATLLTRYRTGAAAAVATRCLARPDARTLGLVGCGAQAELQLRALTTVMRPERIYLADARRASAEHLASLFPHLDCRVCDLPEACGADVLCTLTPSRQPLVRREWVRPGAHINAMGADAVGKQELEIELLLAGRVFVDDWGQASHSGEINVAVREGRLTAAAGTLPDVLCGRAVGRRNPEEITIFDSTGLAIQDMALASLVYREASRRGEGVPFDFSPPAPARTISD